MKFKLTIEMTYEINEDDARDSYGTTDPAECARIDTKAVADDPVGFLAMTDGDLTTRVEVAQ